MEGAPIVVNEGDHDLLNLPPGFRFHPTDEEIITHYLTRKVVNVEFTATAVGEVDLNQCEPWDLPKKAKMGEKEWFFFCQRDRKYPTGMRTNRATESGYWKATGKDKEIYSKGKGKSQLVGMKKTLVFYKGRAPKGEKTNWVMHEFRLQGNSSYYDLPKSAKDEWVVCKVFHKNTGAMIKRSPMTDLMRMNSFVEGLLDSPSLPPLMDHSPFSNINYGIITDENDYKGTATAISARFSDVNSLTYCPTNQIQMQQNPFSTNYQMPNNSMSYSENGNFPYQAASSSLGPVGYLHQQRINSNPSFPESANFQQATNNQRQCKVEQFSSNQSMVSRSQDTGLSTDLTAEISSKQDIEGHSVGFSDLDSFWDY